MNIPSFLNERLYLFLKNKGYTQQRNEALWAWLGDELKGETPVAPVWGTIPAITFVVGVTTTYQLSPAHLAAHGRRRHGNLAGSAAPGQGFPGRAHLE